QPSPDAASDDRRMIRCTMPAGQVTFEGVRLRFDVPRSQSDWVLIQYAPDSTVHLERCVVSIANTNPALIRNAAQVAYFEPGPRVSTTAGASSPEPSEPQLDIQHSILRGDATVIRLPDDAPLRCQIVDSFVATGDRLLESGGSISKPAPRDA